MKKTYWWFRGKNDFFDKKRPTLLFSGFKSEKPYLIEYIAFASEDAPSWCLNLVSDAHQYFLTKEFIDYE